jgi:hypothetical protein
MTMTRMNAERLVGLYLIAPAVSLHFRDVTADNSFNLLMYIHINVN